jgi:hypothetical protein
MIISSIDYSNLPSPLYTDGLTGEYALQPYLNLGGSSRGSIKLRRFSVSVEELSEEVRPTGVPTGVSGKIQTFALDTNDLYEKGPNNFQYGEDGKSSYNEEALSGVDVYEKYDGPPNLVMGLPVKLQKVYFMGERRTKEGYPVNCKSGKYNARVDAYSAYFLCADPIRQKQGLTKQS